MLPRAPYSSSCSPPPCVLSSLISLAPLYAPAVRFAVLPSNSLKMPRALRSARRTPCYGNVLLRQPALHSQPYTSTAACNEAAWVHGAAACVETQACVSSAVLQSPGPLGCLPPLLACLRCCCLLHAPHGVLQQSAVHPANGDGHAPRRLHPQLQGRAGGGRGRCRAGFGSVAAPRHGILDAPQALPDSSGHAQGRGRGAGEPNRN